MGGLTTPAVPGRSGQWPGGLVERSPIPRYRQETERLIEDAIVILDRLRENSRPTPDGGVTWLGPTGYGTELIPLRMVQLGPHLYDGTVGIALFVAALARLRSDKELRALSCHILAPLRRKLADLVADPDRASGVRVPLGGLIGLGSFIYGFLTIGKLLDEPSLIQESHDIMGLITPERINGDRRVRIQTGSAGAILALLALNKNVPGPNGHGKTPLDLAWECARHLIANRIAFDGRPRAWSLSSGKPPLAGFSYGAAGISYALLRLFEATGRQELWDSAQEGLAFLRTLYVPVRKNWLDIRAVFETRYQPRRGTWKDWWASGSMYDLEEVSNPPPVDQRFPEMWCHGAVGIALGRIGALHLDDTPEIRQEVEGVLDRAKSCEQTLAGPDDLCCGYMGLIELLVFAYQRLGREELLTTARALMARVSERASIHGDYRLSAARGTSAFAPTLFQGIAGVGYTLLRLAEPQELPCILLFE